MIKVTKEKNMSMNDVVNIETEEGNFYISFEKNCNLYFSYLPNKLESNDEYSFTIKNDNSFVYKCFDELYDSIISERPFKYSENLAHPEYVYPLSKTCVELVHDDGIIDWHSDDDKDYDLSSTLSIRREESDYIVTFKKSKSVPGHKAYSVCIDNANSGYDPYNISFVVFYNKLRRHDFSKINDEKFVLVRKR